MMVVDLRLPHKISMNLYRSGKLSIKFSITITNSDGELTHHNEFIINDKFYLNLSYLPGLTMTIDGERGDVWDKNRSVMIGQFDLPEINRVLKNYIANLYNAKDMYYVNASDKQTYLYSGAKEKYSKTIKLGNERGYIGIEPDLMERDGIVYEATRIYINNFDNSVVVPFQHLEYLFTVFSKMDFNLYGMNILNYIASYYGRYNTDKPKELSYGSNVKFAPPKESVSTISSNLNTEKNDMLKSDFEWFD